MVGIVGPASASPPDAAVAPAPAAGPIAGLDPWVLINLSAAAVVIAILAWRGVFRPSALAAPRRAVDDLPAWVWLSAASVTWIMQIVGAEVARGVWSIPANTTAPRDLARLGLCSTLAALAAAGLLLHLTAAVAPRAGLAVRPASILLGVGCAVLAWPILQSLAFAGAWAHQAASGQAPARVAHPMLQSIIDGRADAWTWALVGVSVLAVPAVEEIIYRGFVQSLLLRATGRPWLAILLAAAIFGAAHLGQGIPWYAVLVVAALGLAIGLAFERTKRLGVCIGMHAAFNAANVGLALLAGSG